MKKFLFAFAAATISALAVTNGANAQTAVNISTTESARDIATAGNAISSENNSAVAISARAIKNFKKNYKFAGNEQWEVIKTGVDAKFTSDGIQNIVYFNKRGDWFGSMKTYSEDKLDRGVRAIVKREYYDYKITSVQEIETTESNGIPTYVVYLEDDKSVKLVRICNGEMDIYKQYTKQLK